jgi:hypothetical protein
MYNWPTFICEAYTIHAVLRCELTGPGNWKLFLFRTYVSDRYGTSITGLLGPIKLTKRVSRLSENFEGAISVKFSNRCLCFVLRLVLTSLYSGARSHTVCHKAQHGGRMEPLNAPLPFSQCSVCIQE